MLFDFEEEKLLSDLHITRYAVLRKGWDNHSEHFIDQYAQAADRHNVPADGICVAEGEVASDSGDEEASIATTSLSPLAEDLEQYELMKAAYLKVRQEFDTLQRLETVPCRWPLARLSIPLQRIVDRLDRVVAGCCWKVLVTRQAPPDSLTSLRRAVSSPRSPAEELAGGPTKQDDLLQSLTVWEECSSHAQQ